MHDCVLTFCPSVINTSTLNSPPLSVQEWLRTPKSRLGGLKLHTVISEGAGPPGSTTESLTPHLPCGNKPPRWGGGVNPCLLKSGAPSSPHPQPPLQCHCSLNSETLSKALQVIKLTGDD